MTDERRVQAAADAVEARARRLAGGSHRVGAIPARFWKIAIAEAEAARIIARTLPTPEPSPSPSSLVSALAEGLHKAMCFGRPDALHNRLACERRDVYLNLAKEVAAHLALAPFAAPADESLRKGWREAVAYIRDRVAEESALAWPGEIDTIIDDAFLADAGRRWNEAQCALAATGPERLP